MLIGVLDCCPLQAADFPFSLLGLGDIAIPGEAIKLHSACQGAVDAVVLTRCHWRNGLDPFPGTRDPL